MKTINFIIKSEDDINRLNAILILCIADILDYEIKTYIITDACLKDKISELISLLAHNLKLTDKENELFEVTTESLYNSINIPLNVLIFPGKLSYIINCENINENSCDIFNDKLSDDYIKQIVDTGVVPNSILWFDKNVDSETMTRLSKFYLDIITL